MDNNLSLRELILSVLTNISRKGKFSSFTPNVKTVSKQMVLTGNGCSLSRNRIGCLRRYWCQYAIRVLCLLMKFNKLPYKDQAMFMMNFLPTRTAFQLKALTGIRLKYVMHLGKSSFVTICNATVCSYHLSRRYTILDQMTELKDKKMFTVLGVHLCLAIHRCQRQILTLT